MRATQIREQKWAQMDQLRRQALDVSNELQYALSEGMTCEAKRLADRIAFMVGQMDAIREEVVLTDE